MTRIQMMCFVIVTAWYAAGCKKEVVAEKMLPVNYQYQQTQSWCWAATSSMICYYYERPAQQCQIVGLFMNYNCCGNPYPCLNRPGQLYEIQQLFGTVGLTSNLGGPLSFDQIQSEIDAGRPVIVAYTGSFAGHVVVIDGYRKMQDMFLGCVDVGELSSEVFIKDPYYGEFTVPYGLSFSYSGTMTWTSTIYGIRPFQHAGLHRTGSGPHDRGRALTPTPSGDVR